MKKFARLSVTCIMALIAMTSLTGCYDKPNSGEIGVTRNGGPFDNHKIRQIVPNGAGNTYTGWMSQTHFYPVDTQQRFFRLQTCGRGDDGSPQACKGADAPAVTVPTADGVEVTISGTFYLNTVFNNSKAGVQAVKDFDTQFGTRTFGDGEHAYDGPSGWSAFLGQIVEPVIGNNLRETISGVTCAELVSSCALVQNTGNQVKTSDLANKNNQTNVAAIQDKINAGLVSDLTQTLGGKAYFGNIRFNLAKVELPGRIQGAIDAAQAAFANVSQAQARVQAAKKDAQANQERQAGYLKCPTCARIDATRAIPPNITVWAPGGNASLAVGGK